MIWLISYLFIWVGVFGSLSVWMWTRAEDSLSIEELIILLAGGPASVVYLLSNRLDFSFGWLARTVWERKKTK